MSTTYTTNYHLGKQEDTSDNFNMSVITDNMDTIDSVLDDKADKSATYTKTEVDTALNGKADTTDIPTVPITVIQKNGTNLTPVSGTVNITIPTSAADVSALPNTTKYAAALSLTINSSTYVITGQLKDQNNDNLGTAQTIDLPLESVVVGGSYDSQTKKVVLTLQNGNTIEFSVADLVSGLQTELSASNKLNPAFINYDSTHAAVTETEKTSWSGKQDTTLTGYTVDTAEASITASSTVTEGIEQLDYRSVRDKAALIELVNSGAKNLLEGAEQSVTETRLISFNISIPPGKYVIYVGEYSSTDTDDTRAQAYFFNSNGDTISTRFIQTKANGMYQEVTISEQTDHLSIYASDNSSHSTSDTITVAKVMVCTKAAWDISPTYAPYRPSEDEQNAIIATKVTMDNVYGTGKVIPDNSDLDNYKTPGKYGVSSSTHAATISNIPESGSGFALLVMGLNDGISYVRQTFIKSNRPGYYYVRHYTSSTWSDWYKFEENTIPVENRAALIDLIDNGAKNLLTQTGFTGTAQVEIPIKIPAGTYVIYRSNLTTNDTDATSCLCRFYDGSGGTNVQRASVGLARGEAKSTVITVNGDTTFMRIYASDSAAHSTGDTISGTNFMVCTKAAWDISQAYQPYRPTYQELYDMVLALQQS